MQSAAYPDSFKPYPPSWANRLVTRWDNLKVPYWLPYLLLWLVLALIQNAVKWWDGSLRFGQVSLVHVVEASYGPYGLFIVRYLERAAREALETIRPTLGISDTRYAQLEYQLSIAPAFPSLVATLVGLGCGAFYWLVILEPLHSQLLWGTSALNTVVDFALVLFLWAVLGVLFYTSFRQVQIIRRIYSMIEQINLMLPQPLYALSNYTIRAAISGTVFNYGWLGILLIVSGNQLPEMVGWFSLTLEVLIVVVFLVPLWGIHQILLEEKRRLQAQLYERIRQTTAELHRSIDEGNLEHVDPVQKAIASLQIQQAVLDRASTWPWHPETFRILSTAIAAPLVLWFVQRILTRLLN